MAPGPGRLILIPLESRASRICVLVLTLGLAAWLAPVILRPAVADWIASGATDAADLERALAWHPTSPALHRTLGEALEGEGDLARARAHFETASRLRPTDAYPYLLLAQLADREGDRARARQALARALALDRHNVGIRWEAALLFLRWGDRDPALEHFRYVLAVDPRQRAAAFQLARTLLPPGGDAATLLPSDREGLTNLLKAAISHQDLVLAEAAWTRRVSLAPEVPEPLARSYLNLLLEAGHGLMARRVWPALVPAAAEASSPANAVWNGGFETERLLGWGMDWRIQRVWGVDVALDRFVAARGSRSLRLTFNSFPTLDFTGVAQLVAVEPGRTYRLSAVVRASDFATSSGLKLQVVGRDGDEVLAETPPVAGTTADWLPLEALVRIPEGTSLVMVRVRREPAPRPEGNLGGKVWIDEVSLR